MVTINNKISLFFFFFQAEDGIRDVAVTGVQTCALPIFGYVTNDWQLSPIIAAQNGLPYSLVTSGTPSNLTTSSTDPVTGNITTITYRPLGGGVNGSNGRKRIDGVGRYTFPLPPYRNLELRLSKRVRFGDRYSVEALGEA